MPEMAALCLHLLGAEVNCFDLLGPSQGKFAYTKPRCDQLTTGHDKYPFCTIRCLLVAVWSHTVAAGTHQGKTVNSSNSTDIVCVNVSLSVVCKFSPVATDTEDEEWLKRQTMIVMPGQHFQHFIVLG